MMHFKILLYLCVLQCYLFQKSFGIPESCKPVLTDSRENHNFYYKNGSRADPTKAHSPGTEIYHTCPERYYPNVNQSTCGENGKWTSGLYCLACDRSVAMKDLSFPIVKFTSSYQNLNCNAHIISPYVILAVDSCFEESPSTSYYINVDIEKIDDRIDPSKLVKIEKLHYYGNRQNESSNHIVLAEVKNRIIFDLSFTYACIDWQRKLKDNLEDIENQAKSLAKELKPDSIEENIDVRVTSCNNSVFASKIHPNSGEVCVQLGYTRPVTIKKGVGYYVDSTGGHFVKGIAIDTSSEPSKPKDEWDDPTYKALFIGLGRYLDWMKSIVSQTDRDYKGPNPNGSQ